MSPQQLLETVKTSLMEGKNVLQRLIDTEDASRCLTMLPKASLERLQRLIVMNSLCLTKASMFGQDALVTVNQAASLPWLPAIEVSKRPAKA